MGFNIEFSNGWNFRTQGAVAKNTTALCMAKIESAALHATPTN